MRRINRRTGVPLVQTPTPTESPADTDMTKTLEIRDSTPSDLQQIESLYPKAFPDEDLLPVVRALLKEAAGVLSLVAREGTGVVGHVIFTDCRVAGSGLRVAMLAPLGVVPDHQRQGVGGRLVRTGLQRLKDAGTDRVFVLGDPNYYGRFGFRADDRVAPPYPLPEEYRGAWQSLGLRDRARPLEGDLTVPPPWRDKALWSA